MIINDKYTFSTAEDLASLKKVLATKKLSGTSPTVEAYEAALANFFQSNYAVALSSGTAALQVALFAVGVKAGDEVIVSSTCPMMTVYPIISLQAKIVFCDTYCDNFGLDLTKIKKLITKKTKAVIEVPMWGYPTPVDKLHKILKAKRIPLILDLAQAHATKLNNKYLSAYGEIACFSTHDRKILASGEGGFILTNIKKYADLVRSYSQFGFMQGKDFGLNFKLGSLQAALGLNRLHYINKQIAQRTCNAKYLVSKITNPQVKEFTIIKSGQPNYYFLLLYLNFRKNKKFIEYLQQAGIPSDILRYDYKVLYKYPYLRKYQKKCSQSEKLSQTITTIPVHPNLRKKELDYMIKTINNY